MTRNIVVSVFSFFFFLKEQEGQSPSYYILKETDKTMVQKTQPMADRKGSHPIEYTYKPF
jgi:hypothetical protein